MTTNRANSVILGSLSNYMVKKSSVPVMVARKRLRKQGTNKTKLNPQVNVLHDPMARNLNSANVSRLTAAKVD